MTLRHWDSLLGHLDLSDGITFGQDDTYQIGQDRPASGTAPTEAVIKGQGAATGDALPGGALSLAGGDPGAAGQLAGDVVVQLGEDVSNTTAALKIKALEDEVLNLYLRNSLAAIRAGGSLSLQIHSATSVSLAVGNTGILLTLSEDGSLSTSFTKRVIISDGQLVMTPAGSIPASVSIEMDFDLASKWNYVVNGNVAIQAPTNVVDGATYTVRIQQAAPGGFTATWNSVFKFGALSGTLSVASGAIDIFVFEANEGGILHCINAAKGVHA